MVKDIFTLNFNLNVNRPFNIKNKDSKYLHHYQNQNSSRSAIQPKWNKL